MVALFVTIAVVIIVLGAEALHLRRVNRLAALAFGYGRKPALWARISPALRVIASGALVWGMLTLLTIESKSHSSFEMMGDRDRHIILLLDVSPSMRLVDAGAESEKESRMTRARELLQSLFDRVAIQQYKISVIAFYSKAIPVVEETRDLEVVNNILNDLPMHFAFESGKTDLFAGLNEAAELSRSWSPDSTILLIMSDGDTVPATGMPKMPQAISSSLVIGVGDPLTGTFIDGGNSRQDVSMLRQVAARLGGEFHNGNDKMVSTQLIRQLTSDTERTRWEDLTQREYALIAIAFGATVLSLLPLLLHYFGTSWHPGVRNVTTQLPETRGARVVTGARR
ncbi:MAG: VWA domain-containing protein [Planctomycetota bacterium]